MKYFFQILLIAITLFSFKASAQKDSIRFSNGDLIVGEIKSMQRAVLYIETKYSENDFEIEWKEVEWIKTQSHFLIILNTGDKYFSDLEHLNDSTLKIETGGTNHITCKYQDIFYMNSYDETFKDRFNAEIAVGYDLAKAKNLRAFSLRSAIGYEAENWSTDVSFNSLQSNQDSTDQIKRIESELNYRYILGRKWYVISSMTTLSNTEQKLDLRLNGQVGFGRFFIRTNKAYWGTKLGANRNNEQYSNDTEDRASWEAYFGTELNLYDIGDLSLLLNIMAYRGINEQGRWRSDATFDAKYDLPLDFFVRLGASLNFDNQPAQGASRTDYIIQTTFGWEW